MNKTIEQIFRDDDIDEEFIRPQQDQEMAGINDLNDEYASYDHAHPPKKENPYLNFIDIKKYGVLIENE